MRLTVKSDVLVLEAIKVEEMRRGLGRASTPSELARLHIVAVNSRPSLSFFLHIIIVTCHFFYKLEEHLGECPGPY